MQIVCFEIGENFTPPDLVSRLRTSKGVRPDAIVVVGSRRTSKRSMLTVAPLLSFLLIMEPLFDETFFIYAHPLSFTAKSIACHCAIPVGLPCYHSYHFINLINYLNYFIYNEKKHKTSIAAYYRSCILLCFGIAIRFKRFKCTRCCSGSKWPPTIMPHQYALYSPLGYWHSQQNPYWGKRE